MRSKTLLWLIFLFVLIHFLKDITQDILKVPTLLDSLGDVKEDLSMLPYFVTPVFILLGYLSFIAELFLLIAIPFSITGVEKPRLTRSIWLTLIFLLCYFAVAMILDPRFSIILLK